MHRPIPVLLLAALSGCALLRGQTPAEAEAIFWSELKIDGHPLVVLQPADYLSAAARRDPLYAKRGNIIYAEASAKIYRVQPDETEWVASCLDRGGQILWQWQDGDFRYVDCWPGLGDLRP